MLDAGYWMLANAKCQSVVIQLQASGIQHQDCAFKAQTFSFTLSGIRKF
jgi:hypothetical protein